MSEAARKIESASLQRLLVLVKQHTGITMEERKRDLLLSRVGRRMRILGLKTPEEYLEYLEKTSSETQEFVNVITTNETLFFRTPVIWEFFQKEFLPQWYAANPKGTLRLWSAASSSGEEACSICISCEEFKLAHPDFKYQIDATDISTGVLGEAQSGIFSGKSVDDLKNKHPHFVMKYFKPQGDGALKVNPDLWGRVNFSVHNLHTRKANVGTYDLVFLRNVMIYFNDRDQELVLSNIHRTMKDTGLLILGESESLARLKSPFNFKKPLIYQKVA